MCYSGFFFVLLQERGFVHRYEMIQAQTSEMVIDRLLETTRAIRTFIFISPPFRHCKYCYLPYCLIVIIDKAFFFGWWRPGKMIGISVSESSFLLRAA